jgi:hypothetical protein
MLGAVRTGEYYLFSIDLVKIIQGSSVSIQGDCIVARPCAQLSPASGPAQSRIL